MKTEANIALLSCPRCQHETTDTQRAWVDKMRSMRRHMVHRVSLLCSGKGCNERWYIKLEELDDVDLV